jgi:hypothetical protein
VDVGGALGAGPGRGIIRTRGRRPRAARSDEGRDDCGVDRDFGEGGAGRECENPVGVDVSAPWAVLGFDLKSGCEVQA